jgi:hypothetical protein
MKKCPPGVICLENITMFFLIIIIIVIFFIFTNYKQSIQFNQNEKIVVEQKNSTPSSSPYLNWFPSYPYNNLQQDVLLNPYSAPLKDERYFVPELRYAPPGTIPINVSTNVSAVDTSYRQMGILTPLNGPNKNNILPLMGRPLFTRRSLWQYYTISNQHNNIKLPVSVKGRGGLNDNGVDEVYSGDTIYVEGYNEPFKVTVYENSNIKYLPFL